MTHHGRWQVEAESKPLDKIGAFDLVKLHQHYCEQVERAREGRVAQTTLDRFKKGHNKYANEIMTRLGTPK